MVSKEEMNKLIQAGRTAIEYCMVGIVVRPHALTEADEAELEELKALSTLYQRLVGKYEDPITSDSPVTKTQRS